MKQLYHQYHLWEDYISGVWRSVTKEEEERFLKECIAFTGNYGLYGMAMVRVIYEWPITCEHHLTNLGMNRKAWIGHAACQIEFGCPEYITRMAWGSLTKQQQIDANNVADLTIKLWEKRNSLLTTMSDESNLLSSQAEITQPLKQRHTLNQEELNLFS